MKKRLAGLTMAFVIVSELSTLLCQGYIIKIFPAHQVFHADPGQLNRNVGIEGFDLTTEDFEDNEFISKLDVRGKIRSDHRLAVWDGTNAFNFPDSDMVFLLSVRGARVFGVGLGDNDGGSEELSINGLPSIALQGLFNHVIDGQARAYYLVVVAESTDKDIVSVQFSGDGMAFDHLVVGIEPSNANHPQEIVIDRIDGSHVIGPPVKQSISIMTSEATLNVSLNRIRRIERTSLPGQVSVFLRNGDCLQGAIQGDVIEVYSKRRTMKINLQNVNRITVRSKREEPQPAEAATRK
jgi:hypothetical protein